MFGSFYNPIRRLLARGKRAAHTLDEKLRTPKVREIKKEADDLATTRKRKRNDRQEILDMLGLYGNAFSALLATTLIGGGLLSQVADVPLQTLLILDTFNVSLVTAVIAAIVLIMALSQLMSRLVRAAALRTTMFAPWLTWTLWLALVALVLCIGSGGLLLYLRWLPAAELETWNTAARYARWTLSETLPVLGGLLLAAGWLVNVRQWATEEIARLDDEIAALTAISAEMQALLPTVAMTPTETHVSAGPSAPVLPFTPSMEGPGDAIQ